MSSTFERLHTKDWILLSLFLSWLSKSEHLMALTPKSSYRSALNINVKPSVYSHRTRVLFRYFIYRMNNLHVCVSLVDPFQGLPGPPGPEGAEGKPGTQVPILYHISIPSPVNAVFVSVCPLRPTLTTLWFLFLCNYVDFHTHLITHLGSRVFECKTGDNVHIITHFFKEKCFSDWQHNVAVRCRLKGVTQWKTAMIEMPSSCQSRLRGWVEVTLTVCGDGWLGQQEAVFVQYSEAVLSCEGCRAMLGPSVSFSTSLSHVRMCYFSLFYVILGCWLNKTSTLKTSPCCQGTAD